MNVLFKVTILFTIIWMTSAQNSSSSFDNAPHKISVSYIIINNKEVTINETVANAGDLVVGEKQDKDTLLYRDVFINNINDTNNQYFVMKTDSGKYKIRNIRFLNIGRQIGYQYDYKLVDNTKLEIHFKVNAKQSAHLWIELYGYNRTSTIISSGILLVLVNIIFILFK